MAVNLDGMFLVAQAVGKQMIAQGRGGSIIQTASIYGVMAPDQRICEGSSSGPLTQGDPTSGQQSDLPGRKHERDVDLVAPLSHQ